MSELVKLYHEPQRRQFCLLHALNNLFQRAEFNKTELDSFCEEFDERVWFNAHRSPIGWGNYDVNILLKALESRGLEGVWFDKRRSVKDLDFEHVMGFVFNIPSNSILSILWKGRHWFAVRRFGSTFYNLDSKLPEPVPISDFIVFANEMLARDDQLIVVCKPEDKPNAFPFQA